MADLGKIETAVQAVLDQEAMELVDVQFIHESGRRILRFYVDKTGGIKLDDCEYLSHRIGGILDTENLVDGRYVLEVSSPGMDRVLRKEKDFLRFVGHRAKVRLKVAENGQRNFRGFIKPMEGTLVVLESGDSMLKFGLDRIDEARLDPDIDI
ncbi:MAG: ribosome maturation factor RimP [Elusimicrobia bacterium]|nr:ribosome maturation factor RimP [Elusimicrobiota bacterium]